MVFPFFSTIYEQLWLRHQNELSWRWGTTNIIQLEEQRPEFIGKYKFDIITGKIKKIRKTTEWVLFKKIVSFSVLGIFIIAVILSNIFLFLYKANLIFDSWGTTTLGIANAVQIQIFNFFYTFTAKKLNDWENYEYSNDYFDRLTLKLFVFQFVNSYSSLFYIAYAKDSIEGCENNDCIDELSLQLQSIYVTNLLFYIVKISIPLFIIKFKTYYELKHKKNENSFLSEQEKESNLEFYDTPLSDYMEVVISYGYVILFASSFPFTSSLFLIMIILEIRVDAWKLCVVSQRPFPEPASSIGVWLYIIQVMSVVGAVTNIATVVFTVNGFAIEKSEYKWLVFILLEHLILLFKVVISVTVPDVPERVENALVWSQRIVNERLYGKVDVETAKKSRNLNFSKIVEKVTH